MRARSMLLAVTGLALCAGILPASASDDGDGHNTGDQGIVSMLIDNVTEKLQADCTYHQQPIPDSNDTIDVVEGHATFVSPDAATNIAVVVRCRLDDQDDHTVVVNATHGISGPEGVWPKPEVVASTVHPIRVCVAVQVTKENGTIVGGLADANLVCRKIDG